MQHKAITQKIIGCAFNVYNNMGFGFLESVYERCMEIELGKKGLEVERQKGVEVHYDGQFVGRFIADFIIADAVVVELKSVRQLASAHEAQVVNYLAATGMDVGLLINFGPAEVDVRRKVRELPVTDEG